MTSKNHPEVSLFSNNDVNSKDRYTTPILAHKVTLKKLVWGKKILSKFSSTVRLQSKKKPTLSVQQIQVTAVTAARECAGIKV